MASASDIARLIQLNGGQLVGKTRLQKSAYFLETKGIGFGFDFSYYRFGPYSEELASSTDDAEALDFLHIDWKDSQGGTRYAVFLSNSLVANEEQQDARRRKVLDVLRKYSAVEVELAATADFLRQDGFASDPWAETRRRKAAKANDVRLARSQEILKELEQV